MTSSLVGSEMCIRDRKTKGAAERLCGGNQGRGKAVRGGQWILRVGFSAVSYTHLTLPTICSV
eukprot:8227255-Prorocentrum_lima.AAC.1